MKHVFGSVLLGVSCFWVEAYVAEFGMLQWWVTPVHITVAVGLTAAALWFAAGVANIFEG